MVIPTNRPVRRLDLNDQVYKTQREKFKAVIDEIKAAHQRQQPSSSEPLLLKPQKS